MCSCRREGRGHLHKGFALVLLGKRIPQVIRGLAVSQFDVAVALHAATKGHQVRREAHSDLAAHRVCQALCKRDYTWFVTIFTTVSQTSL